MAKTVIAQNGYIAFALQKAKVGDATAAPTYNPITGASGTIVDAGWKRHRAILTDMGPQEMMDMFPLEVGGGVVTAGGYKSGHFSGGTMRIMPRLENSLAQLLFALAGSKSVIAVTAASASETATYGVTGNISAGTRFFLDQTTQSKLPWLTLAKYIPDSDAQLVAGVDDMTEYMQDCRAATATFTVPALGPLVAEFGYIGLDASGITGSAVSTPVFEDVTSVPMSLRGAVVTDATLFPSNAPKFTGAQVIISNGLTQPDSQFVIGKAVPDDLVALNRTAVVRLVYKWSDAALYRKIRWTGNAGMAWQPSVQYGSILVRSEVPAAIATFLNGMRFEFYAPSCVYSVGTPTLQPGQMLQVEVTCVMRDDGVSPRLWEINLLNNVAYGTTIDVTNY